MELSLKVEAPPVEVLVRTTTVRCGKTELTIDLQASQAGDTWEIQYFGSSMLGDRLFTDHIEAVDAARDLVFRLESARLMREQLEVKLQDQS
jgi:hypothetical protein